MQKTIWTLEKVKEGFEKFFGLYNRYPTAYDIDDFDFLPSSRQIQRKFGGLVNLRKELGLKVKNYGKDEERSSLVSSFNIRGRQYENIVYTLLKEYFDEKFIHIEKPVNRKLGEEYDSKNRYDFYVYAKPRNFAVDVFGTNDSRGVVKILNIKENKYIKIKTTDDLYFIYFGENINKNKIDNWIKNRKNKFPENWKILDKVDFEKKLPKYTSYKVI